MHQAPYQHSLDTIEVYKKVIGYFIKKEQGKAIALGTIPESEYIQRKIYREAVCILSRRSIDSFVYDVYNKDENIKNSPNLIITSKELGAYQNIDTFIENFESEIIEREKVLKRQVHNSIEEIIGWNPDRKLIKANYLKIMAKDKASEEVLEHVVSIPRYYDEETINIMLHNHPDEFLPPFARIKETGQSIRYSDVEILGVMNITTLYNPAKVKSKEVQIDEAEYIVQSRIKRSYRELEKFVELILGKREGNLPYDSIAMIAVMPTPIIKTDNKILEKGKEIMCVRDGSRIYKFKDFISKIASKDKYTYLENVMPTGQKETIDDIILKLSEGDYDEKNFNQVITQINDTAIEIKTEAQQNNTSGIYNITDNRKEKLLQGIKYSAIIEGDKRIEIWVMNPLMYSTYSGELIGHTSSYVKKRKDDRTKKLEGLHILASLLEKRFKRLYEARIQHDIQNIGG